jgi:hypothetical protein
MYLSTEIIPLKKATQVLTYHIGQVDSLWYNRINFRIGWKGFFLWESTEFIDIHRVAMIAVILIPERYSQSIFFKTCFRFDF